MKLQTQFPESGVGEFLVVLRDVDLKVAAEYPTSIPRNARAHVRRVDIVTKEVASLSNGATVDMLEFDVNAPEASVKATVTTAMAGTNNDLVFTAKTGGAAGNDITVLIESTGNGDEPLAVVVVGNAITVVPATDSGAEVTSTAADVKAAIEGDAAAAALIDVAFAGGNDGTGVVVSSATPFALADGAEAFSGVEVQDIVASTNTEDSRTAGQVQTITPTAKVLLEGTQMRFRVTAGSTATTHKADVLISGVLI